MARRAGAGLVLAAVVAAAGCSWLLHIRGRVAAEDGGGDVRCTITVAELEGVTSVVPFGDELPEGTHPPGSTVRLGGRFRCRATANVDRDHEVRVRCPGYAPLDVPVSVRSCAGAFFGGCDDIELGTLLVRR